MDLELKGKAVLVTGGAKGIGRAVVEGFVAEGANVLFADKDEEACEKLVESLDRGDQVQFMIGDLTDEATCKRVVEEVLKRFGRLDVLVNNAGVNDSSGFDCSRENLLQSLEKNLFHVVTLTQLAAPELKKNRGSIVNISSKVAVTGQGGTTGYAAAKGAVNALTREWAVDLAPFGVTVNTVVPAECWTPLYEHWVNAQDDPAAVKKGIADLVPLEQRFTTTREIADTVVFVSSPRSSHTTGQLLFVDGGYTHLDRKLTAGTSFHWSD